MAPSLKNGLSFHVSDDHMVVRHEAVMHHLAGRGVLVEAVVETNELLPEPCYVTES